MVENFEAKFGFLSLVSNKVLHHAILLPRIYALESCKLLLEYLAWKGETSVQGVFSSPDNLFFTKFSENEVPLKVGDQDKWDSGARLIIKFAQNTGFSSHKIIVIEDIENATRPALNALLKIIEEPPKNTTFYLIYSSLKNVIETVRSRCYTVSERVNTRENFEIVAEFLNCDKNYEKFCSAGFDFNLHIGHGEDVNILQILDKLSQHSIDEGSVLNYLRRIETFLHQKFLSAKNAFEVREVEKIQKRLFQLKKACETLNTNKYMGLVELTEEIYALGV
jgi:hypothetical protein